MDTSRRSVGGEGVRFPDPNLDGRQQQRINREPLVSGRRASSQDNHDLNHAARSQEEEQLLLHQTVLTSKKQQIELQHERLAKQRAFIRHEKRKLLLQNALLESERERFEASLTSDWFCSSVFPSARDRRLTINVGGQLFEISSALAAKDAGSLLAAFVDDESPLSESECGCFRVDRDWWLFRYVLTFLRDGILPQDPKLLRELYVESEFWKLESLCKAIEMCNMELLQAKQDSEAVAAMLLGSGMKAKAGVKPGSASPLGRLRAAAASPIDPPKEAKDPSAWWFDPPLWWGGGGGGDSSKANKDEDKAPVKVSAFASILKKKSQAKSENTAAVNEADAWWKSTAYKGVDFMEALSSPEKKKQQSAQQTDARNEDTAANGRGTPRVPLIVNTTWASSHHLSG